MENLYEIYQQHRYKFAIALAILMCVLFYQQWLVLVAIFGGVAVVGLLLHNMDDSHPMRDICAVDILLGWALLCWQTYDFILKRESQKAQTVCGKWLHSSEARPVSRGRSYYETTLALDNGTTKTFTYSRTMGKTNQTVCVRHIPDDASLFFADEVLEMYHQ
ncbi:hypothetical protein ACKLNO_02905 [Neisseriaceae bacterium B1]